MRRIILVLVIILISQNAFSGGPRLRETFNDPIYKGYRLDWCLEWGSQCGKPAADAWCKAKGYGAGAYSFKIAPHIGSRTPTILFTSEEICDQDFCDGFSKIVCEHTSMEME